MAIKKKKSPGQVIIFAILLITAVTAIYPIIFMLLCSFKEKVEYMTNIFGLPRGLYFTNYRIGLEKFNLPVLTRNSMIVTVSALLISTLVTSMAAFAFAKLRFRGSNAIFTLVIACMMIPGQILMIPVYLLMSRLGLISNYLSLILFYVTTSIPFATFLLTVNCRSIPDEVLESAEMDGAHPVNIFGSIILPMIKPSVMTLVILNFLVFWNELIYSMLFLQTESTRTLTVAVATVMGRYVTNMPLLMTGLLINSIPTILVFIIFQNYLSKGITVGAIK